MEVKKLPWIEKYRPASLDEMIDHGEKITTLTSWIINHSLTHLIFMVSGLENVMPKAL